MDLWLECARQFRQRTTHFSRSLTRPNFALFRLTIPRDTRANLDFLSLVLSIPSYPAFANGHNAGLRIQRGGRIARYRHRRLLAPIGGADRFSRRGVATFLCRSRKIRFATVKTPTAWEKLYVLSIKRFRLFLIASE